MNLKTKRLEQLRENASTTISELMKSLAENILLEESIKGAMPKIPSNQMYVEIFQLAYGLKVGCLFSLLDMGALLVSEFRAETNLEKRFLLKNIQASILEGYKLIRNFGKARAHSYFSKLKKLAPVEINSRILEIENDLDKFESIYLKDRTLRDVTYHYNDDMLFVYKKTIELSSEEGCLVQVNRYNEILWNLIRLLDEIIATSSSYVFVPNPTNNNRFKVSESGIHQLVINGIRKTDFPKDVSKALALVATSMDRISAKMSVTNRITTKMEELGIVEDRLTKATKTMYEMLNMRLLLCFYYIDLASIMRAYINSATTDESILNLRRLHIIHASTLDHLYGYSESHKEVSFWAKIREVIPESNMELIDEADQLDEIFVQNIEERDVNYRHLHAHYIESSGAYSNAVVRIINSMEGLNPLVEIKKSENLLLLSKRLQVFLNKLMDCLAKEGEGL